MKHCHFFIFYTYFLYLALHSVTFPKCSLHAHWHLTFQTGEVVQAVKDWVNEIGTISFIFGGKIFFEFHLILNCILKKADRLSKCCELKRLSLFEFICILCCSLLSSLTFLQAHSSVFCITFAQSLVINTPGLFWRSQWAEVWIHRKCIVENSPRVGGRVVCHATEYYKFHSEACQLPSQRRLHAVRDMR